MIGLEVMADEIANKCAAMYELGARIRWRNR